MSAQQAQQQASKGLRRVRIILFVCALLILITGAVIWALNSLNSTPALLTTLFGAVTTVIAFIQLIPILFPPKTPDPVSPQVTVNTPVTVHNAVPPTPINIYNVLPSSQPALQVQGSPASSTLSSVDSQAAQTSGSPYANPLSLRSLPLPGGAKHIQKREKNVREIYAQLIEPGVSAVALCGIGGVGKSTLASLVFDFTE